MPLDLTWLRPVSPSPQSLAPRLALSPLPSPQQQQLLLLLPFPLLRPLLLPPLPRRQQQPPTTHFILLHDRVHLCLQTRNLAPALSLLHVSAGSF